MKYLKESNNLEEKDDILVDPCRFLTNASLGMYIYQFLFMEQDKISIIREANSYDIQSKVALEWISYIQFKNEKENKKYNYHSFLSKEYEINVDGINYKADLYIPETGQWFEFLGNYWHGLDGSTNEIQRYRRKLT